MHYFFPGCAVVICLTSIATAESKIVVTVESGRTARMILDGLDAKSLADAEKLDQAGWGKAAAVVVADGTEEDVAKRPAILGQWKVAGTRLIFEPKFPLIPGIKYRVLLNRAALLNAANDGAFAVVGEITIDKEQRTPTTKVLAVYPTGNVLPENQLKLYVHFTAPMTRGEVYPYIRLLDAHGKQVEMPFLELDEELWDRSGTRLTLLFDPGRVKRGLKPREEEGPVLEEGKSYTLTISKEWKDGDGTPLKEEFRKTFKTGPPDNDPPDPKTWKPTAPKADTIAPVQLRFPKPMDHALLQRVLWVVDGKGKKIAGTVGIHDRETIWRFTPETPWAIGDYKIVVETILEDLAANRIGRAFEVEVLQPTAKSEERATVEIPFGVLAVQK